jgi:MFS family permease
MEPRRESRPRLPRVVLWLGLVSLLNDIGTEAVYPLLPVFLSEVLKAPRLFIGIMEGAAEATASLLKLFAGRYTDRLARRKPLTVLGYGVSSVVRPLLGFVVHPWQVLAARLADRVGKGVRVGARDALLAESVHPSIRGRAYGFHQAMDNAGAVVGPLCATGLLALGAGMRGVFFFTAIPGALAMIALSLGVREEPRTSHAPRSEQPVMDRPTRSALSRYLVAVVLFGLGNSSDAFLLLQAARCGIAGPLIPLVWMAHNVTKAALSTWTGALSDRFDRRHVVVIGWVFYALVYLGFGHATRPLHVWLLFVGYGLYYAFSEGSMKAIVADLAPAQVRGQAFGWYHGAVGVVALPASFAFGAIADHSGPRLAFSISAALAGAAALWLLLVVRPSRVTA